MGRFPRERDPSQREDDPQETAGDEFACLDDNGCVNDGGHLFKTCCGETKCVYCPKVAWS